MTDGIILWVCGKATADAPDGGVAWEIQGVYDSEQKAKDACKTPWYFIGPQPLNIGQPHKRKEWEGAYYPLADEVNDWTLDEIAQGFRNAPTAA